MKDENVETNIGKFYKLSDLLQYYITISTISVSLISLAMSSKLTVL